MVNKKIPNDQEKLPMRRLNRILTMLLYEMKDLADEGRDLPVRWNIKHMYSSSQLAKLLAIRRGVEPELAGIAAAFHDIGVVMTGKDEGHAEGAQKYVNDFLERYHFQTGGKLPRVSEEDKQKIIKAIVKHSEKEIYSDDPFVELLKDIDSLDAYLHGIKIEGARLERCKSVLKELDINT